MANQWLICWLLDDGLYLYIGTEETRIGWEPSRVGSAMKVVI